MAVRVYCTPERQERAREEERRLPTPSRYATASGVPVPSVTEVLDGLGLRSGYEWVDPETLRLAAERGDRVHAAIEAFLLGAEPPRLLSTDEPYFRAFLSWFEDVNPEPAQDWSRYVVEERGVVEGSHPFGFRVDLAVPIFGRTTIVDHKCRRVTKEDGLQTAGYERGLRARGRLKGPARRCCLELRPDGKCKVHWHSDPLDLARFDRALWDWHERYARQQTEGRA